jgi:hypothetical protein
MVANLLTHDADRLFLSQGEGAAKAGRGPRESS